MYSAYNFSQAWCPATGSPNTMVVGAAAADTTVMFGSLVSVFACPTDEEPEISTVTAGDPNYLRLNARRSNHVFCVSRFGDTFNPGVFAASGGRPPRKERAAFYNDLSTRFDD